jgi:hypothetical protein
LQRSSTKNERLKSVLNKLWQQGKSGYNFVLKTIEQIKKNKILDIGAGSGYFFSALPINRLVNKFEKIRPPLLLTVSPFLPVFEVNTVNF